MNRHTQVKRITHLQECTRVSVMIRNRTSRNMIGAPRFPDRMDAERVFADAGAKLAEGKANGRETASSFGELVLGLETYSSPLPLRISIRCFDTEQPASPVDSAWRVASTSASRALRTGCGDGSLDTRDRSR